MKILKKELTLLSEKSCSLVFKNMKKSGKIVILKIRYADFSTLTKRKTLNQQTQDSEKIAQSIIQLYETLSVKDKGVRLLGVTVTGF